LAGAVFGIAFLERVRIHGPELLRRRQHDVTDGFPASSLGGNGGGGSGGSGSSSTTLARPAADPIGDFIDIVLAAVADIDHKAQHAGACLSNVLTAEDQMRGRQSAVVDCDCCGGTISGVGDDRRRDGFCPACYKAWRRYHAESADPSRVVFIAQRRARPARAMT
jgi:hypothetical protein